jgi:hypothetical protein
VPLADGDLVSANKSGPGGWLGAGTADGFSGALATT